MFRHIQIYSDIYTTSILPPRDEGFLPCRVMLDSWVVPPCTVKLLVVNNGISKKTRIEFLETLSRSLPSVPPAIGCQREEKGRWLCFWSGIFFPGNFVYDGNAVVFEELLGVLRSEGLMKFDSLFPVHVSVQRLKPLKALFNVG